MAKLKESELEKPAPTHDDEDQKTVAAIDAGLRDAKAGRTVSLAQVGKLLPKSSSSRKDRWTISL